MTQPTSDKQYCPRAIENGGGPDSPFHTPFNGEMHWRDDDTCSYCGSLHPDTFMTRLESGDVTLTPTDKSCKVYICNEGGAQFKQSSRRCPPDADCKGPDECAHWETREMSQAKFYFQHLSGSQRRHFVELYNEGKLQLNYPGHFYVAPYFTTRKENNDAD